MIAWAGACACVCDSSEASEGVEGDEDPEEEEGEEGESREEEEDEKVMRIPEWMYVKPSPVGRRYPIPIHSGSIALMEVEVDRQSPVKSAISWMVVK